jgi:hypothetical protein
MNDDGTEVYFLYVPLLFYETDTTISTSFEIRIKGSNVKVFGEGEKDFVLFEDDVEALDVPTCDIRPILRAIAREVIRRVDLRGHFYAVEKRKECQIRWKAFLRALEE